jgi:hypothetical protein
MTTGSVPVWTDTDPTEGVREALEGAERLRGWCRLLLSALLAALTGGVVAWLLGGPR